VLNPHKSQVKLDSDLSSIFNPGVTFSSSIIFFGNTSIFFEFLTFWFVFFDSNLIKALCDFMMLLRAWLKTVN
jgi:hypothetical protein